MAGKNVLMVVLDDLRDFLPGLGGYGGTVDAPVFAALSRQGTLFTQAFAQAPLCAPSRTSLLTGLQPSDTGILENGNERWADFVDLATTLPGTLEANGYATALAGKLFHNPGAGSAAAAELFDFYALPGKAEKARGGVAVAPDGRPLSDEVTVDRAIGFLGELADGPAPFFLGVGLSSPHVPSVVPREFFDRYPLDEVVTTPLVPGDLDDVPRYAREELLTGTAYEKMIADGTFALRTQGYLAEISYADRQIGRLVEALRASGRADDTVIVVTSDHGFSLGEKGVFGKDTLWEESARVPLLIVDPGLGRQVRKVDEVASLVDLYPTLMDLLGTEGPAGLDGRTLAPFLTDPDASWDRPAFTFSLGNVAVRTDGFRLIRYRDGSTELYDLGVDPDELRNLADSPAYKAARAELDRLADGYFAREGVVIAYGPARELAGSAGDDAMFGSLAGNRLVGRAGDDLYFFDHPEDGAVEAAGGGTDRIVALQGNVALPGHVEDAFLATGGRLVGNGLDNVLSGGGRLQGLGGDDRLDGGNGNDGAAGGAGDDELLAGIGDDRLDGEAGTDLFDAADLQDAVRVDLAAGTAEGLTNGADTVLNVEDARGGFGDDALRGDVGANALSGGLGADELVGRDGDDELLGGGGRDLLFGDRGADRLVGGAGGDVLRGAGGGDLFAFEPGAGADRIVDFGDVGDRLAFDGFGPRYATAEDVLASLEATADGVRLRLADPDGRAAVVVTLAGLRPADLDAADLLVTA